MAADPDDIEASIELGNIYRSNDRFADAAAAYSRGINAVGTPEKTDWRIYYYRGVALERAKQWPQAEADFKQALALNPDQPQVLNYLGYSWVDRGENLDEALGMIKKAVSLSPNDGYIVDSLGWAYHRLKRDPEAVTTLENAIELKGGRRDHQRSPRRRVLVGRAQARGILPVGARARLQPGQGRTCRIS